MNKMKSIAVDDEPLALSVIEKFAQKSPFLDLIGTFTDPMEALEKIQTENIDLLFLDIEMPDLNGIQFLQSVSQRPMVIFTTAYSHYAIDSYEYDAVDYLLKPILFDRFIKAVSKAHERLQLKQKGNSQTITQEKQQDFLFIKSDSRFFRVSLDDILYIEGMRDYIAIHTPQQRILTLMSMTRMMEKLPDRDFMRVHKSYIIGLKHISLVQHNRVYIRDREIPVSNSYKEELNRFIEESNLDT